MNIYLHVPRDTVTTHLRAPTFQSQRNIETPSEFLCERRQIMWHNLEKHPLKTGTNTIMKDLVENRHHSAACEIRRRRPERSAQPSQEGVTPWTDSAGQTGTFLTTGAGVGVAWDPDLSSSSFPWWKRFPQWLISRQEELGGSCRTDAVSVNNFQM